MNVIYYEDNDVDGFNNITIMLTGLNEDDISKIKNIEGDVKSSYDEPDGTETNWYTEVIVYEYNEIELDGSDLKWEYPNNNYTGGQTVGFRRTDVKVTHIPTGIFAACDYSRNIIKNKEIALKLLISKLNKHNYVGSKK